MSSWAAVCASPPWLVPPVWPGSKFTEGTGALVSCWRPLSSYAEKRSEKNLSYILLSKWLSLQIVKKIFIYPGVWVCFTTVTYISISFPQPAVHHLPGQEVSFTFCPVSILLHIFISDLSPNFSHLNWFSALGNLNHLFLSHLQGDVVTSTHVLDEVKQL